MATCTECPDNTPEAESLPSQVSNMIKHFFGTVTKIAGDNDTVDWILPCDLTEGIYNEAGDTLLYDRQGDEGLACFFNRVLGQVIIGAAGADAYATVTEDYTQPAVLSTVVVTVDNVAPFSVDQNVWVATGGYYSISEINGSTLTLVNLFDYPFNVNPTTEVVSGSKLSPSGLPETSGPQGAQGATGATGETGAAGQDSTVPGPQGDPGAQGPAGESAIQFWNYKTAGTHVWVVPAGVTSIRLRVYAGGGGGGGGATAGHVGYGAGGGEYADKVVTGLVEATVFQLFVGAGGAGGSGGDTNAFGNDGTRSYVVSGVTTHLESLGGKKGGAGLDGAGGAGGTGGSGTAVNRFPGIAGAVSNDYRGGRAGREGAGGPAAGNAGEAPGGGGAGGAGGSTTGGAGGTGMIVLEIA